MNIQYVLMGEVRVPIFKWKGYDPSWTNLRIWCKEVGVLIDYHFEPDPVQPNWLTLWTGEKYSRGKGCSYRVVPGMYIARLPGSWPFLMSYSREDVVKLFKKSDTKN